MCPAWRHISATWRIQMNLCFLRSTRAHNPNANPSVQPFLHSSRHSVVGQALACPFLIITHSHGDLDPSNACSLGPTRVHNSNGISIGSAVLHRWLHSVPFTMGCPFSLKIAHSHGGCGPHLIHGSLGPPESSNQTTCWSLQPCLQGSLVWQTDRPSYSVGNSRPHLRT